jgi:hypothetical protein
LQSVNWAWGLSLIALTIAIHTMGVVMMAIAGLAIRVRLETRNLGFWHVILIATSGIGVAGLLLAMLHGIEAAVWAAAHVWLGALDSLKDAVLYSLDSLTTRGASGLTLEPHWQLMGALEAAQRHAAVRYQHSLHLRGDAGVLVDALRSAPDPITNCRNGYN